jgi:hypothetical protein
MSPEYVDERCVRDRAGRHVFVARPEDPLSHRSSIDLPGSVKHTRAKTLPDCFLHRLVRQNLVPDFISIDQQHVWAVRDDPAGD